MAKKKIFLFFLLLSLSCKRVTEEEWKIPEIEINLIDNISIEKNDSKSENLLFFPQKDITSKIDWTVFYRVKQRGKGIPSLVAEIKENFKSLLQVSSIENKHFYLTAEILNFSAEINPEIKGVFEELKNTFEGKKFFLKINEIGEVIEVSTEEKIKNSNAFSHIKKIFFFSFPVLTSNPIHRGKKWSFKKNLNFAFPEDEKIISHLNGITTFLGRFKKSEKEEFFVIESEFELLLNGREKFKGMKVECNGKGKGKGGYFLSPLSAMPVSGNIRIFEHKNYILSNKKRKSKIEQFEELYIQFNLKNENKIID